MAFAYAKNTTVTSAQELNEASFRPTLNIRT